MTLQLRQGLYSISSGFVHLIFSTLSDLEGLDSGSFSTPIMEVALAVDIAASFRFPRGLVTAMVALVFDVSTRSTDTVSLATAVYISSAAASSICPTVSAVSILRISVDVDDSAIPSSFPVVS